MRLTTIILIASLMQVSAATFAQLVTLNKKNVQLETVLKDIRKQTGYDFYYDGQLTKGQKIDIDVKQATVDEALNAAFKNLPLNYTIDGQIISITKKPATFLDNIKAALASLDVHGRVVDEKGQPLAGVTIRSKDGSHVTTTDRDGNFVLKRVDEKSIIVISFIGYLIKETDAITDLGTIQLKVSNSKLDEVQIIAYGSTSQRLSTGNVSTIKSEDINQSVSHNPLIAIQGRLPGVFIEQTTGFANGGVKVRIQGQNSLGSGLDPLYVVDNVPYPSQLLPNNSASLGYSGSGSGDRMPGASGNPLSFINPGDIESIDILKDADATAIYGSRAANGAILITTKKGKAGDTKVNFNLQQGYGEVGHRVKLLNTEQYLQMRSEALKNDGLSPSSNQGGYDFAPELILYNKNVNTDWQKILIGGTAHFTDLNSTISGGNDNTQFLFGLGYKRQTTVFPTDVADQKGSFHFSLTNTSPNKKLKFNFTTTYLYDADNSANTDPTNNSLILAPNGKPYNDDGSLYFETLANGNSAFPNPLRDFLNKSSSITKNLIANSVIDYQFFKELSAKINIGYSDLQSSGKISTIAASQYPESRATFQGIGNYDQGSINTWIVEPQLNYKTVIAKGIVNALVGTTFQKQRNVGSRLYAIGFANDGLIGDINSAQTIYKNGSTASLYSYNAFFSRLNYNWFDKYIFNINARTDGSSRFGSQNRFHTFGSAAAAWVFTNETFFKNVNPILSLGKLKASYGLTGNDQIGDYTYLNQYVSTAISIKSYQGGNNLQANGLPNPYLEWELTKKLNLGLDLSFFTDKLTLSSNYYRNSSSNLLSYSSLPSTTGNNGIIENFPGTLSNTGFEFAINWRSAADQSLVWSAGFNLTVPRNKLVAFPNLESSTSASTYIIGKSINIIKAYKYAGVNSETGIYQFLDKDGNIVSDPTTDQLNKSVILDPDPKFYGGFQSSISYHNLSIDILLQYVKQSAFSLSANSPGQILVNQPIQVLDRWTQPGDKSSYEQFATGLRDATYYAESFVAQSDRDFKDASYLRLKNLSLSYTLPSRFAEKAKLKKARIYLQGQNLFTITNYIGLDPETKSNSLPPLRFVAIGFQIEL
jgi:TonB-linked SusC/RagA family outer membrane protein